MEAAEIERVADAQRAFFQMGRTLDVGFRRAALQSLYDSVRAHERDLARALEVDLGKSASESYMTETGLVLDETRYLARHLRSWARPRRHLTPLSNFPAKSRTVPEPYGDVLVMAPWNYPVLLTLEPVAGAVAAGNCCVLKPSAYAPATSAVLRAVVEDAFERGHVDVVEGGRAENTALLDVRWDYILFTGSVSVGRLVMEKASRHLTPVSLELGGKSPCIVDETADLSLAARRIAFGKYLNCGQTCIAPDYALVQESVKDAFLAEFARAVEDMYGADPLANPAYGKIVNEKHFERLLGLIDADKVVFGGQADAGSLRIAPTLMDGVAPDDAVMGEEIFGPILPVIGFSRIEEAEKFVREREKPLALYLFTKSKATERRIVGNVSFGGGCVNDTIMHIASSRLPFGGIGNSGMGAYHGKWSFDTFSHEKVVVEKSRHLDLPFRYQPYNGVKDRLIRLFVH